MTRELLDKLSGGNKAGLLLDVLNQDEVVKVIEHNDFVTIIETTEPMVEVKILLNSQEDFGNFVSIRSTLGETENRLVDDQTEFHPENIESAGASEDQDCRTGR